MTADPANDRLDARAMVALGRRYGWAMAGIVALVVVGAVIYTAAQTPTYRAEARVLVRTESNQRLFPVGDAAGDHPVRDTDSEGEYLTSDEYVEAAVAASGSDFNDVRSHVIVDDRGLSTNTLSFIADAPSAVEAAAWASSWASTYVSQRHALDLAKADSALATLREASVGLRSERAAITDPIGPLDEAIAGADDPDVISRLVAQRDALVQSRSADLAPIDARLAVIDAELAELLVQRSFLNDTEMSARVVRQPRPPDQPDSPVWSTNLALAAVAGLGLAALYAYSRNHIDDRIRDALDAASAVDAPDLAALPLLDSRDFDPGAGLISATRRRTVDAAQRLVTSVEYVLQKSGGRAVLVTSAAAGAGKSTVAANLAGLLGRQGIKVVLVDADLRRPSLHHRVGASNDRGITTVLTGRHALDGVMLDIDEPSTVVLPAGPAVSDPADMLRSDDFFDLMSELHHRFDRVIVDAPPVLPVTDAAALVRCVDATIMVTRSGHSRRAEVIEASRQLRAAGAIIMGVVLTGVRRHHPAYEYYAS